MAAATRPGPADARVPCPLCGGLIHPIAGRCKHCKEDLRTLRGARPAAGATLPALGQSLPVPQVTGSGNSAANSNGHTPAPATNGYHPAEAQPQPQPQPSQPSLVQQFAAAAPLGLHQGAGAGPVEAVPILPPRPTGRYAAPAPRAAWKSWPVIVIILAAVAIVTAVVLMLFPPGGADPRDEGMNRSLLPAPDRMDTNPAPTTPRQPPSKSTDPDPWSRGSGADPKTPPSAQATPPPDDPDIDDPDVDDTVTRDPFSRRGGLGGGAGGLGISPPRPNMLYSIIKHACTRLSSCSGADARTKSLCDLYSRVPATTPSCAAATRCLRSIDDLSCDDLGSDAGALWQLKDKIAECADALSC
ncbi:MAG TPA: hypothetical protein VNO30_12525 [Kofleriaceae bacterium]|nr:hypothetical protein [Kofleriaceae bacterium]